MLLVYSDQGVSSASYLVRNRSVGVALFNSRVNSMLEIRNRVGPVADKVSRSDRMLSPGDTVAVVGYVASMIPTCS